jgi:hypothetical protein
MPELGKATYVIEIDSRDFDRGIDAVRARTRETATQTDKDTQKMKKDWDSVTVGVTKTSSAVDRNDRAVRRHRGGVVQLNAALGILGHTIKLLKWPAIITGAGLALQALSALGAGAVALTGALGPLTGALASAGAAYGALGQAMAVIKLSQFGEISKALSGNEEAMKRLNPQAKAFAKTLKGLKPELEGLRGAAQRPLFRGLNQGIKNAIGNLPSLRRVIRATSQSLGGLASQTGKLFGDKGFGQAFERVGKSNAVLLRRLGGAVAHLARAFVHVLDAARPLTAWIGKSINLWARQKDAFTESAKGQKHMGKFFGHTKQAIKAVIGVLAPFGRALIQIGHLGRSVGMSLFKHMGKAARSFEAWTKSAKGKNEIRQYFKDIKPTLIETGRLLSAIVKAFVGLGRDQHLAPLLKQLRTEALPAITGLIQATTSHLGPVLIDLLTQMAKLLGTLGGYNGPLYIMFQTLDGLAKALNFIFGSSDILASSASWGITLIGIEKVTVRLFGIWKQFTALKVVGFMWDFARATLAARGANLKLAGTMLVVNARAKAAAAWEKLVGVMAAVKKAVIGLSITTRTAMLSTGIGALIVGAALIATHWKQTKHVLGSVWKWIKKHATIMAAVFLATGPIGWIIAGTIMIIKHWKWVKNALHNVWGWIKHQARAVGRIVSWMARHGFLGPAGLIISRWGSVKKVLGRVWDWMKGAARDVGRAVARPFRAIERAVRWVIDSIKDLGNAIKSLPGKAGGFLKSLPGKAWDALTPNRGGLITPTRVSRFATGGPVGLGRDSVPALLTPGEFVINRQAVAKTGMRALAAINRGAPIAGTTGLPTAAGVSATAPTEELADGMKEGYKKAQKATDKFSKEHKKKFKDVRDVTHKHVKKMHDDTFNQFTGMRKRATGQTDRIRKQTGQDFSNMRRHLTGQSQSTKVGVGQDFSGMRQVIASTLNKIAAAVNKALKAFGVAKVKFSTGGVVLKARGGYLDGQGLQDTVPVLAAPGEAFLTRHQQPEVEQALAFSNAMGVTRAGSLNEVFSNTRPHYMATGGRVQKFAAGGSTVPGHPELKSGIAKLWNIVHAQFPGLNISSTTSGRHAGNSLHYTGEAVDSSASSAYMYRAAAWIASHLTNALTEGIHNPNLSVKYGQRVSPSFWGSSVWAGHADHIHLGVKGGGGGGGIVQLVAQHLQKIGVKGPPGALKSIAAGAIEMVRKGANKYIDKKSRMALASGGLLHGSGDVQATFAAVARALSTDQDATLALGEAGFVESEMRDLSYGDASSQGALQLLASTAAGLGISPHDEKAVASAFFLKGFYGRGGANHLAAQGLPAHVIAQSVQGSAFPERYAKRYGDAARWMRRFNLGPVPTRAARGGFIGSPRRGRNRFARGGRAGKMQRFQSGGKAKDPNRMFVMVMENLSYENMAGQPYWKSLAHKGANFTNLHAGLRPSQPNYSRLFSGKAYVHSNTTVSPGKFRNKPWLGGQLSKRGISNIWYEGEARHSPGRLFGGKTRGYSHLASDLSNRKMEQFVFASPGDSASGHDTGAHGADRELHRIIPKMLAHTGPQGMVLVTFDEPAESASASHRIPTVIVGPGIKHANVSTQLSHLNLLGLMDKVWGLKYLPNAGGASKFKKIFKRGSLPKLASSSGSGSGTGTGTGTGNTGTGTASSTKLKRWLKRLRVLNKEIGTYAGYARQADLLGPGSTIGGRTQLEWITSELSDLGAYKDLLIKFIGGGGKMRSGLRPLDSTKDMIALLGTISGLLGISDRTRRVQYPVIRDFFTQVSRSGAPFGGIFHGGGIVPGRRGEPRTIIAQGGELVAQPGTVSAGPDWSNLPQPIIIVEDGAVDSRRIKGVYRDMQRETVSKARRRVS